MLQLHITGCPRDIAEEISETLESLAILALTLTDNQDNPILEPELGTTPLWPTVIIDALFSNKKDAEEAQRLLAEQFPSIESSLAPLPDHDWERLNKDQFTPKRFGSRLWICPSWTPPPDPEGIHLILDPGLAFGTGSHATTSLCLTWLAEADVHGKTMIDYGCGSGILALSALKLGAQHVSAVDIDAQALLATNNNALANGLSTEKLTICPPDSLKTPVDLLLANILLAPLITLKTRFESLLKANGLLVVSGLLEEQANTVITAYATTFTHERTISSDGWSLVVFALA